MVTPLWVDLLADRELAEHWLTELDHGEALRLAGLELALIERGYRTRSRLNDQPLRRPVAAR